MPRLKATLHDTSMNELDLLAYALAEEVIRRKRAELRAAELERKLAELQKEPKVGTPKT